MMTVRCEMARANRRDWGDSGTTGPTVGEPGSQDLLGRRLGSVRETRTSSSCSGDLLFLLSKVAVPNHHEARSDRSCDGAVARAASVPTHACTQWLDPGHREPLAAARRHPVVSIAQSDRRPRLACSSPRKWALVISPAVFSPSSLSVLVLCLSLLVSRGHTRNIPGLHPHLDRVRDLSPTLGSGR